MSCVPNEGKYDIVNSATGWQSGYTSEFLTGSGKFYFEATFTMTSNNNIGRIGICWETSFLEKTNVGENLFSLGYGGTGMKSWNRQFSPYGRHFSNNDTIGCYINLRKEISFSLNGSLLGTAFEKHELPQSKDLKIRVAYSLKDAGAKTTLNLGASPFKFSAMQNIYRPFAPKLSVCSVKSLV